MSKKKLSVLPAPNSPEALTIEHLHQLGIAFQEAHHIRKHRWLNMFCTCHSYKDDEIALQLINYNRTPFSTYGAWMFLTDIIANESAHEYTSIKFFSNYILDYYSKAFGVPPVNDYNYMMEKIIKYYTSQITQSNESSLRA